MKGDEGMTHKRGKADIGKLSVCVVLLLAGFVGISYATNKPECIKDSKKKTGFIISSAPCGTYGIVTTRTKDAQDVVVQYMVHRPAGVPKALVVLFAGGNGDTGIEGDPATGEVTKAGNNFLVRSAQLFAKNRYLAVTIDRPLVGPTLTPEFPTNIEFDQYRISAEHGTDIGAVISEVNTEDLPVFLAGTSRGALSAVAQHKLDLGIVGILLASPETSSGGPGTLYIGRPNYPNLQPEFVTVFAHVLAHELDGCFVSTPENSEKLHHDFINAGVDSRFDEITGGFDLTGTDNITACDAKTHHGFLGVENKAVKKITKRMDQILKAIKKRSVKE